VEVVDVADHLFSRTIAPWERNEAPRPWKEAAARADAFVIVSPEYNHGYPGELKILLDSLNEEYRGKPALIAGVSSGPFGGTRMADHLKVVLAELKMVALRNSVHFPMAATFFGPDGLPADPAASERMKPAIDELLSFIRASRSRAPAMPRSSLMRISFLTSVPSMIRHADALIIISLVEQVSARTAFRMPLSASSGRSMGSVSPGA
jgi:NAD(P)H-dependent FMN reductase